MAKFKLLTLEDELFTALKDVLPLAERYLSSAPSDPDNAKLESARGAIRRYRDAEADK